MDEGDAGSFRPGAAAPDPPAPDSQAPDLPAPDLQAIARDWITLWQSELTAAAADREVQESWQRMVGLWAGAATALVQALPRGAADGWSRAAAPPRPAPAAAAPDPRDAEIERLVRRIDALERRLADLEGASARRRRR